MQRGVSVVVDCIAVRCPDPLGSWTDNKPFSHNPGEAGAGEKVDGIYRRRRDGVKGKLLRPHEMSE